MQDEEDDGIGTVASPIVIEISSSSEDDQERDDDYELRVESSSDEEVLNNARCDFGVCSIAIPVFSLLVQHSP